MKSRYNYIFLDLDDTIWDFHANAKASLHDVYFDRKLNEHYPDFEHFFHLYARRNLELWSQYGQGLITKDYLIVERFRHLLSHAGIQAHEMALNMNTDFLDILSTKTILMPYAGELLEYCTSRHLPMTIISNGFTEVQYRKLRNSNIEQYFTHVVLSEAVGALKPSREIFEYALKLNNARADETLMIGDSFDADILGAVGAGIDAVYLNNTRRDIEIPEKVTQISSLKEVFGLI
ncbi:MAG TPA: YjjG family noncanonical pyrimidine nucleotidase [Paludibacteraceae bacterium]|nr:YjjG family noncanonical pyrimidine nucleotidase [Paludibacteraceae bacterium]